MPPSGVAMTLEEAAERLGVHYMTVYRYVRTGRLPAEWRDGRWHVHPGDLGRVARSGDRPAPPSLRRDRTNLKRAEQVSRLVERLIAGDTAGSWSIVESALSTASPTTVHLGLIGPALQQIGAGWETGRFSVAEEHRATAVALGIVGRLSPLFLRPGRRRIGAVLLAGAAGDNHAIPLIMVADMLRAEGFEVVHLGPDVPPEVLVDAVRNHPEMAAVGLSVSSDEHLPAVTAMIDAMRAADQYQPVLVGGPAVTGEDQAISLGADGWAPDAASASALFRWAVETR